jgi:hypothetical protein
MWQSSNGSLNAPTIMSIIAVSFIRAPNRMAGEMYGLRLMFSAPPATVTPASPRTIDWAAVMIACKPLPHRRFRVSAGVSCGRPPVIAATRAK